MIEKNKIDSVDKLLGRYGYAKNEYISVKDRIADAYRYFAPNRNVIDTFLDDERAADSLTKELFDDTAQEALNKYASNLHYSLIPPNKKFAHLVPSPIVAAKYGYDSGSYGEYKKQLEEISEQLFHVLEQSNLQLAMNESFVDSGISTGIVLTKVNNGRINYQAITPSNIYIDEDPSSVFISDFFLDRYIKARDIKNVWVNADLTEKLNKEISENPDKKLMFIEACVYYPQNLGPKKFYYYVQYEETKRLIYGKWLTYNPFTAFRAYKRSGEIWGRGIADRKLPTAKMLNTMGRTITQALKFSIAPPIAVVGGGPSFNAKNVRLIPGAVINVPSIDSIQLLNLSGNPEFILSERQKLQQELNDAFYTDAIGQVEDTKNRTATEMQIRNDAWLRNNAVSIGRIYREAVEPIITKTLILMREQGMIEDPTLGTTKVIIGEQTDLYKVSLESPLVELQDKDDALAMDGLLQRLEQIFGSNMLSVMNITELTPYYADKLGVPLKMLKDKEAIEATMGHINDTLEKNRDALAQQHLQAQAEQQPSQDQTSANMNSVLQSLRSLS